MTSLDWPPLAIPLSSRDGALRGISLVDAEDAFWLIEWPWRLHSAGYAFRGEKRRGRYRTILLARLLLGLRDGDPLTADHINRDRLDNRRSNLRVVTRAQNNQNVTSRRGSSSTYRGVSWNKRLGKWQATATCAGRRVHLGFFDTEVLAAGVAAEFRRTHMPFSAGDAV